MALVERSRSRCGDREGQVSTPLRSAQPPLWRPGGAGFDSASLRSTAVVATGRSRFRLRFAPLNRRCGDREGQVSTPLRSAQPPLWRPGGAGFDSASLRSTAVVATGRGRFRLRFAPLNRRCGDREGQVSTPLRSAQPPLWRPGGAGFDSASLRSTAVVATGRGRFRLRFAPLNRRCGDREGQVSTPLRSAQPPLWRPGGAGFDSASLRSTAVVATGRGRFRLRFAPLNRRCGDREEQVLTPLRSAQPPVCRPGGAGFDSASLRSTAVAPPGCRGQWMWLPPLMSIVVPVR